MLYQAARRVGNKIYSEEESQLERIGAKNVEKATNERKRFAIFIFRDALKLDSFSFLLMLLTYWPLRHTSLGLVALAVKRILQKKVINKSVKINRSFLIFRHRFQFCVCFLKPFYLRFRFGMPKSVSYIYSYMSVTNILHTHIYIYVAYLKILWSDHNVFTNKQVGIHTGM